MVNFVWLPGGICIPCSRRLIHLTSLLWLGVVCHTKFDPSNDWLESLIIDHLRALPKRWIAQSFWLPILIVNCFYDSAGYNWLAERRKKKKWMVYSISSSYWHSQQRNDAQSQLSIVVFCTTCYVGWVHVLRGTSSSSVWTDGAGGHDGIRFIFYCNIFFPKLLNLFHFH